MMAASARVAQPPPQAVAAAAALPSSITPTGNNKKKWKSKVSGQTYTSPYNSILMQPTDGGLQLTPELAGFLNATNVWHGVASEQGNTVPICVPTSKFARHVERVSSQPSSIPPTNNELQWNERQWDERGSNVAATPTATSTTTPVTCLVWDFKTKVIHAAQPVYDIENDWYDTPNLGAQVNARYLYKGDWPNDLL